MSYPRALTKDTIPSGEPGLNEDLVAQCWDSSFAFQQTWRTRTNYTRSQTAKRKVPLPFSPLMYAKQKPSTSSSPLLKSLDLSYSSFSNLILSYYIWSYIAWKYIQICCITVHYILWSFPSFQSSPVFCHFLSEDLSLAWPNSTLCRSN